MAQITRIWALIDGVSLRGAGTPIKEGSPSDWGTEETQKTKAPRQQVKEQQKQDVEVGKEGKEKGKPRDL